MAIYKRTQPRTHSNNKPTQHPCVNTALQQNVVTHREGCGSGRHWRTRLCCRQRFTHTPAPAPSLPTVAKTTSCACAALAKDGKYHVRVQTRNPQHRAAQELAQLPNVSFHVGHIESDDLLREAMQGMDGVFFLANGFAIGEKAEIFWSMRAFEIARETGIKYFQFSALDYATKKGGYDPKFRCAHYDAKGRVAGEFLRPIGPVTSSRC
jgi:hypothetical protein